MVFVLIFIFLINNFVLEFRVLMTLSSIDKLKYLYRLFRNPIEIIIHDGITQFVSYQQLSFHPTNINHKFWKIVYHGISSQNKIYNHKEIIFSERIY
jgi:hypothetical protein